MRRDTGVSPRAGTSQGDLARVHNGRAPKVWVRRMSGGGRQRCEVLYWDESGTGLMTGALLSWGRLCGLERRWIKGEL